MLIQKKSLAEEVAVNLKEQIGAGKYAVGSQLPVEPELMKMFGVGRSTIREAIKLLANTGLLRVQQGVGTFVENLESNSETMDQRLKRAKEQEVDEVRQLLELKIAEKAALNRSSKDLQQINKHLAARKKAADNNSLTDCIDADIAFHTAIATAAGNAILTDLYKTVSAHLKEWFLSRFSNTAAFTASYPLHKRLMEAIEAKDPSKALKLAAEIISH
jgi:DNA-binding FadR family transcriptional regulator